MWCTNNIISRLGLCNVDPVYDRIDLAAFKLRVDTVGEKGIASFVFELHNTFFGVARYLNAFNIFCVDNFLDKSKIIRR